MSKARGVSRKIAYRKESTWGTLPGATGAKYIRRVTADFNLTKETYSSNEINPTFMMTDFRHGVRSATGAINAELSPGSYSDFIGSVLARDFATGATATGLSLVITASGTNFAVTRSTGSWLTDGFKVGTVVRITAGTGAAAVNLNNNALIVSITALGLVVQVLSRFSFVPDPAITAATVATIGKTTYVPKTGHTDDSYTFENWFSDIGQSEVYTGLKVGSVSVSLPSTGLVTSDFSLMGKDLTQTGTSQYFTTPTDATTTGIFAAVQGALILNGQAGACITDASINIERAQEAAQCVGSNNASDIFVGGINVSGSLSAYFSDGVIRDYFANETPVTVVIALTTSTEKNADVVTFVLPKTKLCSSTISDNLNGLVQAIDFTSLLNDVTTGGLIDSVILVQDTSLV